MAALERVTERVARERAALEDKLTEEQFVEALRQALACGDFLKHVTVGESSLVDTTVTYRHKQAVSYVPYRERERLMAWIRELEAQLKRIQAACSQQDNADYE